MNLNNGTSDPVDYEQSGGGEPLPEEEVGPVQTGTLAPDADSGDFIPAGRPPYTVHFNQANQKNPNATSCAFSDAGATVTLNSDWTVSVSSGCD